MVEYTFQLNDIFGSLADATRRDMLHRLMQRELNISELAEPYDMSFAAVSKHLKILERARLIIKRRQGREQVVALAPETIVQASTYLKQYEALWNQRFDRLEEYLKEAA